jgi:hypothetical protein
MPWRALQGGATVVIGTATMPTADKDEGMSHYAFGSYSYFDPAHSGTGDTGCVSLLVHEVCTRCCC